MTALKKRSIKVEQQNLLLQLHISSFSSLFSQIFGSDLLGINAVPIIGEKKSGLRIAHSG